MNYSANTENFNFLIQDLYKFLKNQLKFNSDIKLVFKKDSENSKNILGKTGFYDPQNHRICLYVSNRHPKDILRSFAHEIIHHFQNCRGDDLSSNTLKDPNYTQNNNYLREREKEAYELGNLLFRDWEDQYKKDMNLMEDKNLVVYKVFDKDGKFLQRVKAPKGSKLASIFKKLYPENFDKAFKAEVVKEMQKGSNSGNDKRTGSYWPKHRYTTGSEKKQAKKVANKGRRQMDKKETSLKENVSKYVELIRSMTDRQIENLLGNLEPELRKQFVTAIELMNRRKITSTYGPEDYSDVATITGDRTTMDDFQTDDDYHDRDDTYTGDESYMDDWYFEESSHESPKEPSVMSSLELYDMLKSLPHDQAVKAIESLDPKTKMVLQGTLGSYGKEPSTSYYGPADYSDKTDSFGRKPSPHEREMDQRNANYFQTDEDELYDDERGLYEANKIAKKRKWKLISENTYKTRIKKKDKIINKIYKLFNKNNKIVLAEKQENNKYKVVAVEKNPKHLFEMAFAPQKYKESKYGDYISQLKVNSTPEQIEKLAKTIKGSLNPEELKTFVSRLSDNFKKATGSEMSTGNPKDNHEKLVSQLRESAEYLKDCLLEQTRLKDNFVPFWKTEIFDEPKTKQSEAVWNHLVPSNKIYKRGK